MSLRRYIGFLLLAVLVLAMFATVANAKAAPVRIKETQLLTWNGSAWAALTKGYLYAVPAAGLTLTNTTGNGLTLTGTTTTSGNAFVIKADDDIMTTGSFFNCLGGASYDTSVFKITEGGILTFGGGATIDNATSATVLNLTETTVRATGAFDVTGNSTLASVDVGGGSGGSGATIASTGAATFDGLVTANGGIVCDTNKFAVADTTGIVTLGGGGTIDNNTDTAILNLTETTVKATGNFQATGTITSLVRTASLAGTSTTGILTTAAQPSGSRIIITAATATVTLPAVATSSGVEYTIIMAGATSLTITSAAADLLVPGTTVKTSAVYTTTILNSRYICTCDGTNWFVAAIKTGSAAPDSSS